MTVYTSMTRHDPKDKPSLKTKESSVVLYYFFLIWQTMTTADSIWQCIITVMNTLQVDGRNNYDKQSSWASSCTDDDITNSLVDYQTPLVDKFILRYTLACLQYSL
jgi:hypothetical protein